MAGSSRSSSPHSKQGRFLSSYVPYVLRQADQTLSAPFYSALAAHGVARSEWRVLAVLYDLGELSVIALTEAALSPQPTVTNAVRRLEDRGLVIRTPGTEDRRQRFVSLTSDGHQLTAKLIAQARDLEADMLAGVDDIAGLLDDLKALTATIEARTLKETA